MKAIKRCSWCTADPLYVSYHDEEWGVPEFAAGALFERLVLEGMQAGLSWLTVLKKRAHMRERFFDFDMQQLSLAGDRQVGAWLSDAGLIRHRGKLEAMVLNARLALAQEDFAAMLWRFAPGEIAVYASSDEVPSTTEASKAMSAALKAQGFKFVGPTICYAFMQSVGMVNDHVVDCARHLPCAALSRTYYPVGVSA